MIRGSNFRKFVNFLAQVKQGQVGGIKVRLDRLQALISTSCIEHLEFGRDEDADRALQHRLMYVGYIKLLTKHFRTRYILYSM